MSDSETSGSEPQEEQFYHYAFDKVLRIIECGEYPYMFGEAGAGKNIIAEQVAEKLSEKLGTELPFGFSGKVSSEYKLKGFKGPNGYSETLFVSMYKNGGLFFLDEIDSSDPDALTAINAAIANGYLDVDHHDPDQRIIKMHPNFYLIAGGNTRGFGATTKYTGRQPLDGATLSRFKNVEVSYDVELERKIANKINGERGVEMMHMVHQVREAVKNFELEEIQNVGTREMVAAIKFEQHPDYTVEEALIDATMDKLELPQQEKVIQYIKDHLQGFEAEFSPENVAKLHQDARDVADKLRDMAGMQENIRAAQEEVDKVCTAAFDVARILSSDIETGQQAVDQLKAARELAASLNEPIDALIKVAKKELKSMKNQTGPRRDVLERIAEL